MKEGTIIKLNQSIFGEARGSGSLMRLLKTDNLPFNKETTFAAVPIGEGWEPHDYDQIYYITDKWIDHTYKHKEDEP